MRFRNCVITSDVFIIDDTAADDRGSRVCVRPTTYFDDGRVVRHLRQLPLRLRRLEDGQVLDIAPLEDDVVVHLFRRRDLFVRDSTTTLGAIRDDLFQGDRGSLRVDLM